MSQQEDQKVPETTANASSVGRDVDAWASEIGTVLTGTEDATRESIQECGVLFIGTRAGQPAVVWGRYGAPEKGEPQVVRIVRVYHDEASRERVLTAFRTDGKRVDHPALWITTSESWTPPEDRKLPELRADSVYSDDARACLAKHGTQAALDLIVEKFSTKANQFERVSVVVWTAHLLYVQVIDTRLKYPDSIRANLTVDGATGILKRPGQKPQHSFYRMGWGSFVASLVGDGVPNYGKPAVPF